MRVTLTRRCSVRCFQAPNLFFFVLLFWSVCAIASTNPTGKSVLIINDVGLAHPASAVITREVMSELAVDNDYQVEFYVDSLDFNGSADKAPQAEVESRLNPEIPELQAQRDRRGGSRGNQDVVA
jgi:hypothetical protein